MLGDSAGDGKGTGAAEEDGSCESGEYGKGRSCGKSNAAGEES